MNFSEKDAATNASKDIPAQNENLLLLEGLVVSYGKAPVLRGIDLKVKRGACFGLMGLNGSGKTTMIKAILGLRKPNEGSVLIDGETPGTTEGHRKLAYLPERFDPPWFMKGLEFINFSTGLYGRTYEQEKIFEEARMLALDPTVLKNKTQGYSKGMRQKLGIMATLMTQCPLLILDEPMSGLDPKARALVKAALLRAKRAGITMFISSHILPDMEELCDQVALLHEGEIRFTGTPQEMKEQNKAESMEKAFLGQIGCDVQNLAA